MKALLYTSDPYEPSGVVGLFETEDQKQQIIAGFTQEYVQERVNRKTPVTNADIARECKDLTELEIPVGVYGRYY